MKVEVNSIENIEDEKAVISVVSVTEEIQSAIDILENNCRVIPVTHNGETVMCKTDRIYYIESVDKKTFVYTKDDCFESKLRLYELEEKLNKGFVRCAKAMIVNIRKINSVKSDINGRMTAELLNKEQIVIARSYVKDLKGRLGL